MKNPYANPDPHLLAQDVVAMTRQIGATVIGWSHNGQTLTVTTTKGSIQYAWSTERGDWVWTAGEVAS